MHFYIKSCEIRQGKHDRTELSETSRLGRRDAVLLFHIRITSVITFPLTFLAFSAYFPRLCPRRQTARAVREASRRAIPVYGPVNARAKPVSG